MLLLITVPSFFVKIILKTITTATQHKNQHEKCILHGRSIQSFTIALWLSTYQKIVIRLWKSAYIMLHVVRNILLATTYNIWLRLFVMHSMLLFGLNCYACDTNVSRLLPILPKWSRHRCFNENVSSSYYEEHFWPGISVWYFIYTIEEHSLQSFPIADIKINTWAKLYAILERPNSITRFRKYWILSKPLIVKLQIGNL